MSRRPPTSSILDRLGDCYPVVPTRRTPLSWNPLPKDRDLPKIRDAPSSASSLPRRSRGHRAWDIARWGLRRPSLSALRPRRDGRELRWCCRSRSPDCVRTATSSRKRRPVPSVGVTARSPWRHGWVASITGGRFPGEPITPSPAQRSATGSSDEQRSPRTLDRGSAGVLGPGPRASRRHGPPEQAPTPAAALSPSLLRRLRRPVGPRGRDLHPALGVALSQVLAADSGTEPDLAVGSNRHARAFGAGDPAGSRRLPLVAPLRS